MTEPPIDDELREKIRKQYGDGIPEDPRVSSRPDGLTPGGIAHALSGRQSGKTEKMRRARDEAAIGQKRARTGKAFEAQLDDTHAGMLQRGEGYIIPHYPPTVQVGRWRAFKKGGGPCDYSGHVNSPAMSARRQVPVVFDAKVLGLEHLSYTHDPEKMAQLQHLKNATIAGAAAFLLVYAPAIERVFVVGFSLHGAELVERRPIQLYEKRRNGWSVETRLGRSTQVPHYDVFPLLPSVPYTIGKGWLWAPLLRHLL